MATADFDALMSELDALRRAVVSTNAGPAAAAQRDPAVAPGATDLLAALEHAGVERSRIDQVMSLIELASALDAVATIDGGAGVGSTVYVEDRAGRESAYELVAQSDAADARERVSLGSPVGRALLGARPGDRIRITLGNGRRRNVRVVNVQPRGLAPLRAALGP